LLAVHLLEADAPDSVLAWEIGGFELAVGDPVPYIRLPDRLPESSETK
jgi:hypothetical protein